MRERERERRILQIRNYAGYRFFAFYRGRERGKKRCSKEKSLEKEQKGAWKKQ